MTHSSNTMSYIQCVQTNEGCSQFRSDHLRMEPYTRWRRNKVRRRRRGGNGVTAPGGGQ